ncbi:MAG: hypothetical protein WCR33_04110 [Bacilli bacterium]|jgi:hypothetical protein
MDISKLYTKTMHKALQNALSKQFRIDYSPAGGFISHIRNNKQGVIFSFNTRIGSAACMTAESFIKYDYNKVLDDLQRVYHKCVTDNMYQLKGEYYQDRYSLKI